MMAFIGVRISWLMVARKVLLARLALGLVAGGGQLEGALVHQLGEWCRWRSSSSESCLRSVMSRTEHMMVWPPHSTQLARISAG